MSIEIENPCAERWEDMERRGEGRFCERCERTVVDLSRLTQAQAEARVRHATGRLCLGVRMDARTHEPIFRAEPARAAHWAGGLVLAAALTSGGCAPEASTAPEIHAEIAPPGEWGPSMLPISADAIIAAAVATRAIPIEELALPEDSAEPTATQRRLTRRKSRPVVCALPPFSATNSYMLLGR